MGPDNLNTRTVKQEGLECPMLGFDVWLKDENNPMQRISGVPVPQ